MGFQSHSEILVWTTVVKAERKPLTGRWKSWAPKPRPELVSGMCGQCMRQESWHKLQQGWDTTICTFSELARADGQDQVGIEQIHERWCYKWQRWRPTSQGSCHHSMRKGMEKCLMEWKLFSSRMKGKNMNARVGSDNTNQDRVMGKEGCGSMNNNEERLLEFCTTYNLVIRGTLFPHHDIHKLTWCSPNGKDKNQMISAWSVTCDAKEYQRKN